VLTSQRVHSLPEVQIFVLNCIILQSFVKQGAHGVKAYPVSFQTHLAARHLKFPRRSYCQNTEDYAESNSHAESALEPFRGGPFTLAMSLFLLRVFTYSGGLFHL
jgi:hypothetical protein